MPLQVHPQLVDYRFSRPRLQLNCRFSNFPRVKVAVVSLQDITTSCSARDRQRQTPLDRHPKTTHSTASAFVSFVSFFTVRIYTNIPCLYDEFYSIEDESVEVMMAASELILSLMVNYQMMLQNLQPCYLEYTSKHVNKCYLTGTTVQNHQDKEEVIM